MLPNALRSAVITFSEMRSVSVRPVLLAACLVTASACSHLREIEGLNAIGAYVATASYRTPKAGRA
jgi:hypothetical protein